MALDLLGDPGDGKIGSYASGKLSMSLISLDFNSVNPSIT